MRQLHQTLIILGVALCRKGPKKCFYTRLKCSWAVSLGILPSLIWSPRLNSLAILELNGLERIKLLVSRDITESNLVSTFKQFGHIRIEWPGKDQATSQPKGYVYIIFESEKQVKALLTCCTHDFSNGGSYYYKISSKRMKGKQVQVIPWALNDSNFVKSSSQKLDPKKTVFVGALHGMITATALAKIMNDLFGNVIYAGIDTDKHKYPIGSARVTFSRSASFDDAVNAAFIQVKTAKFTKKLQVDPYIEDTPCSSCYVQQGPYFCKERSCFKYYCHTCWQWAHHNESKNWHEPMSRGLKSKQVIGLTSPIGGSRTQNSL